MILMGDIVVSFRHPNKRSGGLIYDCLIFLTQWDQDKMAISQETFSNTFSWIEMYEFCLIYASIGLNELMAIPILEILYISASDLTMHDTSCLNLIMTWIIWF